MVKVFQISQEFSEDPGSAQQGGEAWLVRKGVLAA